MKQYGLWFHPNGNADITYFFPRRLKPKYCWNPTDPSGCTVVSSTVGSFQVATSALAELDYANGANDGGLKTGYDVMMGALLGADEFGFGTCCWSKPAPSLFEDSAPRVSPASQEALSLP